MSSIFQIIETFFFISLGITFILVLLLVFHFKFRLSSLEEKHDKTLEIINNIVGEMQYMKKNSIEEGKDLKRVSIDVSEINGLNGYIENDKIDISSDEEENDDSDDDTDDGSDYGSDDGSNDGSDDGNDDDSDDGSDDGSNVKVVKLNDSNCGAELLNDVVVKKVGYEPTYECLSEIVRNETAGEPTYECLPEIVDLEVFSGLQYECLPEIVDTIDEEVLEDLDVDEIDDTFTIEDVAVSGVSDYRKHTLQSLKNIVLSKGLSPDPSKLKKKELLQLLS